MVVFLFKFWHLIGPQKITGRKQTPFEGKFTSQRGPKIFQVSSEVSLHLLNQKAALFLNRQNS